MSKNNKKFGYINKSIKHAFTGNKLTAYSGISPISKYIRKNNIWKTLFKLFPTVIENAGKFSDSQLMLLVVYASLCKVKRLTGIETFSKDVLVRNTLNLEQPVSDSTLSERFKSMGEKGARTLEQYQLETNRKFLLNQLLTAITIDMDSTVSMVYGNQEGASKGFNEKKRGAKSYHPLLAFISDYKLVMHTWFRTGNAYTSNGSEEFIRQLLAYVPGNIKRIFFRMDSGFFDNNLLEVISNAGHTYLVKVKFKGMRKLLAIQNWKEEEKKSEFSTCEFAHTFNVVSEEGKKVLITRNLKAVRVQTVSGKGSMGEDIIGYDYFCYSSNLEDKNAIDLHNIYRQRGESENWIEQVKNHLLAGKTLVDDFWANDIFWQLSVMAYNLSIRMRLKVKKYWQQEYNTFREWFVSVPGILINSSRQLILKIYEHYYYKDEWMAYDLILDE